jgi:hypothetical protein
VSSEQHPIYYSVQAADYAQDPYMDICSLLPATLATNPVLMNDPSAIAAATALINNVEIMQAYTNQPNAAMLAVANYINGSSGVTPHTIMCSQFSGSSSNGVAHANDDACNASRNSTTTTSSGSNSTTSSKLKLTTSSPTDSLAKNSLALPSSIQPHYSQQQQLQQQHRSNCCCTQYASNNSYSNPAASFLANQKKPHCCTNMNADFLDDRENNAYTIMRMINEKKSCICPPSRVLKFGESSYEMYSFNLHKSGGFVEIPKFYMQALVPDEACLNELDIGIYKINEDLFNLECNLQRYIYSV